MFEEMKAWLLEILPPARYKTMIGEWVEQPNNLAQPFAVLVPTGGMPTDVDDRRTRYRVILLGPRNQRGYAPIIAADMESLMLATLDGIEPCGAADIRAMSEPSGPGFTTEDRAWYWLDFEVTF